jgi:hypothetical protein
VVRIFDQRTLVFDVLIAMMDADSVPPAEGIDLLKSGHPEAVSQMPFTPRHREVGIAYIVTIGMAYYFDCLNTPFCGG